MEREKTSNNIPLLIGFLAGSSDCDSETVPPLPLPTPVFTFYSPDSVMISSLTH